MARFLLQQGRMAQKVTVTAYVLEDLSSAPPLTAIPHVTLVRLSGLSVFTCAAHLSAQSSASSPALLLAQAADTGNLASHGYPSHGLDEDHFKACLAADFHIFYSEG